MSVAEHLCVDREMPMLMTGDAPIIGGLVRWYRPIVVYTIGVSISFNFYYQK